MSPDDAGKREVLSSLPHRRPQRPSSKRNAPGKAGVKPKSSTARSKSRSASSPGPSAEQADAGASKAKRATAVSPPFRAESQGPVTPPSRAEILSSSLEAAAELARLGLNVSKGLLRSAASRLPRP